MNKFIILDMDNTLIDTNPLYLDARRRLGNYMVKFGFNFNEVVEKQKEIDLELFEQHGFSLERFPLSFVKTAKYFIGDNWIPILPNKNVPSYLDVDSEHIKKHVYHIALDTYDFAARQYDDVDDAIKDLMSSGYKIGMITAGEEHLQMKRFKAITVHHLFTDCWVVLKKTKQVFDHFCIKNNIDKDQSWMVGDSISSDIIPAHSAGLNTIHIDRDNHDYLQLNLKSPAATHSVLDLKMASDIILRR